jgi:hypothetical protein
VLGNGSLKSGKGGDSTEGHPSGKVQPSREPILDRDPSKITFKTLNFSRTARIICDGTVYFSEPVLRTTSHRSKRTNTPLRRFTSRAIASTLSTSLKPRVRTRMDSDSCARKRLNLIAPSPPNTTSRARRIPAAMRTGETWHSRVVGHPRHLWEHRRPFCRVRKPVEY